MKSLLAVLALAVALGAGYWKFRNPDAGVADLGGQAAGQAGLLSSAFGFGGADTSKLEADLASSQAQLQETSAALQTNRESLDDALQRLSVLETQFGETDTRLETTAQAFSETSNALKNQGNTLNERLAAVENEVGSLGSEMATSNSAITQKLESDLASRIASQQSAIAGLEASLASNTAKSSQQFTSELANLEQRLDAVTNSIGSRATTEDLDQIQQQVAELKSQVAESEATIGDNLAGTFDEKFASISSSIDEKRQIDTDNNTRLLRQSVNRMDNQIKAISAASGEAGAALELSTALDNRIDEVENALAEIDQNPTLQRLDSRISASVAEVDSSVQQLESSIAEINTSIDNVQTAVNDVNQSVAGIEETVESNVLSKVSEDTATMVAELDLAREKVAALESEINKPQDSSAVDTRLSELDARIGSLEIEGAQLAAALPQSDGAVENAEKISALETEITTLNDTLLAIRENTNNTSTGSDTVAGISNAQMARIDQRLQQMEERIASSSASEQQPVTVTNQATEELQLQIAQLEDRLKQQPAPQTDPRLASEVDQLNKKLTQLEQERLAALKTEERGKPNEYKIYFGKDSVSITEDAENVLKSFIRQEGNRANSVSIFGFTDRSGNAAYNQRLALRRANEVRSFIIQQGFDFRKISAVDGLGEDPAASNLDDGVEDANQRTVVLYAYPQ